MTLIERITALAAGIATHIKDNVTPRLAPSGGATGAVLTKASGTGFDYTWVAPKTIVSATVNGSNHLILTFSDASTLDAGVIAGGSATSIGKIAGIAMAVG